MTSATATLLEAAPAPRTAGLRARAIEFAAVGGATLVLYPLSWLLRRVLGLDAAELGVSFTMFYGAYLINDPHFAVTYLLFYDDARRRALGDAFTPTQRVRYWIAGFFVPLALVTWAAIALTNRSPRTMGWMIQLMFFLVGWHYVKQGFGVLSVLSARRGVRFTPVERAAVLFHCFAGWAYAWSSPFDPGRTVEEKGVVYTSIAQPPGLERITQIVFFASALPVVWALAAKWRRERRLPPLAPLAGLLVTVWAWTVYSGADPLMMYVIPALHSIQYLYFVWLLKRNEARAHEGPPWFGRPARVKVGFTAVYALGLGWLLFHGAPTFLDDVFAAPLKRQAPNPLGPTPWFAALFVFVNIHHYFMDHVIWRRDNPQTRHLAG